MNTTTKNLLRFDWIIFPAVALLLFFPILHRSFAADDFLVLKRVALDRVIRINGFFRPFSDITLLGNYLLGGFNPIGYYLFNILLHGVNACLLFRFCRKWIWTNDPVRQQTYALLAALFFVAYPFHNETIVWALGRASLLANTCGIAAMLVLVGGSRQPVKMTLVCLFYFIGLTAYESIIVLPLMVYVVLYRSCTRRQYLQWAFALGVTFFLHLVARIAFSGVVMGSYGEAFLGQRIMHYAANLFKVTGRLFLPPVQQPVLMAGLIILLFFLLAAVVVVFLKKYNNQTDRKRYFLQLVLLVAITAIIPVLFDVSTRTSESDRFFYFPSFFLCSLIAYLFVSLIARPRELAGYAGLLMLLYVYFLQQNNANWNRASGITNNIINAISLQQDAGKIYVINLPDELDGAFIFRQGLPEAMTINGLDPGKLIIVNHLKREDMLALPDSIAIETAKNGQLFIGPAVTVKMNRSIPVGISAGREWVRPVPDKSSRILYWNKKQLVLVVP